MRTPAVFLGALIALSAAVAGAAQDTGDNLLALSAHPEFAPYAAKVREVLQASGNPCDEVIKLNAFPQGGNAMLVVVHCSAGKHYEAAWDGTNVRITAVP